MFKNKKGFNLFTALIALMLVSIAIVFIYNMVQTEENYLALIEDQSKTSDLLTIADLYRADAFNIFVVSFRERYEEFRSSKSNHIKFEREEAMLDWNSFVDYYANYIFFDQEFETFFASSVVQSLTYSHNPIGYKVDVLSYDREKLAEIIREAFNQADEKIKVIGCEQDIPTCLGTLNFKIDTRGLSDQNYEALPMISVTKNIDNLTIQRPVFARREYRVYLPWRGFHALRVARNFVLSANVEKLDNFQDIISQLNNSNGFFNVNIFNTLNSAKLGVCDIGSCAIRKDLFITVDKDGFQDSECDQPPNEDISANNNSGITINGTTINLTGSYSYNPEGEGVGNVLNDLVKTSLKSNILGRNDISYADGLKTITSGLSSGGVPDCPNRIFGNGFDLNICDIKVTSDSKVTKKVIPNTYTNFNSLNSVNPETFSTGSFNEAWNLGLKEDLNRIHDTFEYAQNILNNKLKCHKIGKTEFYLKFEETNPKYIVNENNKYVFINIIDNYSKYSFFNDSYSYSVILTNRYFPNNFSVQQPEDDFWTCNNYEAVGSATDAACSAT